MKQLYLLFLLIPIVCFSQEEYSKKRIDSLLIVLNTLHEDTSKVNMYHDICVEYELYDLKEITFYNDKLLQLAKKIKYEKGVGFYYYHKANLSLQSINFKQAIVYAENGSRLFYKIKDWDNYILQNSRLANYLISDGQYNKAKDLLTEKLTFALKKDSKYVPNLYIELCYLFTTKGDYAKAIEYITKGMNCKSSPQKMDVDIYNKIAHLYRVKEDYDKSLIYNNKARSVSRFLKSKYYTIFTRVQILCDMGRPQEALPLAFVCQKYFQEKGFTKNYYYNQYMISYAYYKLGNYNKAKYYIDEVLKQPIQRKEYQIDKYCFKTKIHLALNDLKTAKLFIDKALNLLDNETSFNMIYYTYRTKTDLDIKVGNYKSAFYYKEKLFNLLDHEYYKRNINKVHELEAHLDINEKDNNIKTLKLAQLQKTIQINKQNSYITYGIIFILFILAGLLIFSKQFSTIKKKNSLISINNTELENAKAQLEKSVQVKETLLKEIHHRVKNNLQLVMSLLYIQSKEKDKNMDDFLEISQSRIIAMALIHENLYQTEDLSKVDFKEYASSLTQSIIASYNNLQKDIQLIIEIDSIYIDIQTAIPLGLIINELISNAYKHAFVNDKKGIITLQLVQNENDFELVVKDNGVGMAEKKSTKKSLGLELVQQLVSQIQGSLQVQDILGLHYQIQFQNIAL